MDSVTIRSLRSRIRMDLLPYCKGGSMIPVDLSANCESWIYDRNGSGIQILGIRSRDPFSGCACASGCHLLALFVSKTGKCVTSGCSIFFRVTFWFVFFVYFHLRTFSSNRFCLALSSLMFCFAYNIFRTGMSRAGLRSKLSAES